jgi:hypothetical protein
VALTVPAGVGQRGKVLDPVGQLYSAVAADAGDAQVLDEPVGTVETAHGLHDPPVRRGKRLTSYCESR